VVHPAVLAEGVDLFLPDIGEPVRITGSRLWPGGCPPPL